MRTLLASAIALLYGTLSFGASDDPSTLAGYWSGSARRDGVEHAIAVRLAIHENKLVGTVDWPSMGYIRTDLLRVTVEGTEVRIGVPLPIGSIKLIGVRAGDSIRGTLDPIGRVKGEWQSLGAGGSFELHRAREPKASYRMEEVRFANGNVTLAGTLFLPVAGDRHAAIVYIAGSGDATRGDGSFLADHLARSGIAALVYDKRGTGQSTGDWHQGGFEELADDATAALRFLRSRADISPESTGFVCQSQGCWVAPIALRRGAPAQFLVAQSGPAVSVAAEDLDHYRVTLTSQGFGEPQIAEAFELVTTDQRVSLGRASWADLQQTIGRFRDRDWFEALGYEPAPEAAPIRTFDRHTLDYDPAANLDALTIPSLWIYGDADTIIPVRDCMNAIRKVRAHPGPQLLVLPKAGHTFTVSTTAIPQMAEGYPDAVIRWIDALNR